MKTLDKYLIKVSLGPFVLTFFISLFILLMQFLWKYVDDLVGKGLEWYIIAELMFYASASLVPLALPLAVLLSSIMTFGNLGEHYELVAMKSSGSSLQRIMASLTICALLVSITTFYFSNNILPVANLKFGSLYYDITQKKPSIEIQEGIFYSGIEGYTFWVGKKDNKNDILKNVIIYDHTDKKENVKITLANSGKMELSPNKQFMLVTLFDGYSYDEHSEEKTKETNPKNNFPLIRYKFKEQTSQLDLSAFKLVRTEEELFKDNYGMLNLKQLDGAVLKLDSENVERQNAFIRTFSDNFFVTKQTIDSLFQNRNIIAKTSDKYMPTDKKQVLETALNMALNNKDFLESFAENNHAELKHIQRHKIEWHKKFTLSFACLIFFFIGAPLGAIIRKGGLGMPVVVSVLFFIVFHVLSITGEKFVREGVWDAPYGMWLASVILLPIGIILTIKATRESVIFDIDFYLSFLKNKN